MFILLRSPAVVGKPVLAANNPHSTTFDQSVSPIIIDRYWMFLEFQRWDGVDYHVWINDGSISHNIHCVLNSQLTSQIGSTSWVLTIL